jgi:hypothetical protein
MFWYIPKKVLKRRHRPTTLESLYGYRLKVKERRVMARSYNIPIPGRTEQ